MERETNRKRATRGPSAVVHNQNRALEDYPADGRLQALETKVRSFEPQVQEKESRLGEKEKENCKFKEQVSKHERKNQARKENVRKYRKKKTRRFAEQQPERRSMHRERGRYYHLLACLAISIFPVFLCPVCFIIFFCLHRVIVALFWCEGRIDRNIEKVLNRITK
ncbi:MAG: hypothetical protein ACTSXP_18340 [Promethearchaeota archaeon]